MITRQELNPHGYAETPEIAAHLDDYLRKINIVRTAYGKPMIVTSGLRSNADQARINPKAPKSKHLTGEASDIQDLDGSFWAWCMVNIQLFIDLGLYFEDKRSTPTWVHIQSAPPKSGKRIFIP